MIDLEMMACLLAALPPRARLILLGDKDQLASVEAGAVLGGHPAPDAVGRFENGHGEPCAAQLVCGGKPRGTCSDDEDV